jgi:hypothetical protein
MEVRAPVMEVRAAIVEHGALFFINCGQPMILDELRCA